MQANELRIGNKLEVAGNYWTVNTIIKIDDDRFELYFDENEEYDHSLNAKRIPLTEEWLLKLGFETTGIVSNGFTQYAAPNHDFSFNVTTELQENVGLRQLFSDEEITLTVKYVHQLQNLYHALTSEELVISPSPVAQSK